MAQMNVRLKRTIEILAICSFIVLGAVTFPKDAIVAKETLRMSLERTDVVSAPVIERNEAVVKSMRNL